MVDPGFLMRNSVTIPAACRERYHPLERPALDAWRRSGVEFSGVSDLVPGYRIANVRPDRIMVIITAAGAGWALSHAGRYDLTPGTIFVSGPGPAVGWGTAGGSWRMSWWYLQTRPAWNAWGRAAACLGPCPQAGLLTDLSDDLQARSAGDDPHGLAAASALLALRHLGALAGADNVDPASAEERFARLWKEVARSPGEDWSLPYLAARLDMSVSTFQRLARSVLGEPPHHALKRLRMEQGRLLLTSTRYPIHQIASLAGYADAFAFSSAYRAWFGHPPKADRTRTG